jgi:hypothetical protein
MRLMAKTKRNKKNLLIVSSMVLISLALIVYPFFFQFIPDSSQRITVQANVEAAGFATSNSTAIEAQATGCQFNDGLYNVTIPGTGCYLDFLNIAQDNEVPALFDSIVHNSSGKVSITLTNISYFYYERTDNSTAHLLFQDRTNSFLPNAWYPIGENNIEDAVISAVDSPTACDISASGGIVKLFLSIYADNGSLQLEGSENYSLPIVNDYVGLLLEATTPHGGSYPLRVSGNITIMQLKNWQTIDYFMGDRGS